MPSSHTPELAKSPSLRRLEHITGAEGRPVSAVAIAVLFLWTLYFWILTVRRIVLDYNPLPVWDYWQIAEHLKRYQAFDLSVLWIQHNEHRIVFPESIFALDMLWFGGHQIFALAVSFACYFGVWLILAWALRQDRTLPSHIWTVAVLLAGIIIGWEGSSVVVGNTFLLQWTMLQFVSTLGLLLFARSFAFSSARLLTGAIVCGVVATYSSGNGMLLWPILLGAAVLLRFPVKRICCIGLAGAVSVGLYFVGYHSISHIQWRLVLAHPTYFVCFVAAYVSMPLGAFGEPIFGVLLGLFNLGTWCFIVLVAFRKRLITAIPAIVFFGSIALLVGSAALTASGRMDVNDPAYTAARAARYVSLPLVNWGVLVLALMWIAARCRWQLLSPATVTIMTCLLTLGMNSKLRPWVKGNGSFIAEQQVASIAVENRVFDPYSEGKLYISTAFLSQYIPVLASTRRAIFSGNLPELSWLGRQSASLFESCSGQTAEGSVSAVYPVDGGVEVTGNAAFGWKASRVVFVDERGKVVGFGEQTKAGVPDILVNVRTHTRQAWVGFISSAWGSGTFSTFLVDDRRLCPLAGAAPVPKVVAADTVGAPISGVTWSGSGWAKDLYPVTPNEPLDKSPLIKSFWSSWNGSDASTGQLLSSAIAVPKNGCLVVSTLHGPMTGGLSLKVLDASNSRELDSLSLRSGEKGWKFWRVPLVDRSAASVRIVATDKGSGWGQWFAIARDVFECN